MKKYLFITLFSFVFMTFSAFSAEKIRIACVGDSITFGSGIKAPEDRYPQQLGSMLGEDYEVGNFGISGATLLTKGNKPYIKQKVYADAIAQKPNIVIIKLGTNDSKMQNWDKIADFEGDLIALIDSFAKLETKPTVYLCTPCPVFGIGERISGDRVLDLVPLIRKIAKDKSLKLIDFHTELAGKKEYFPDRVHPNAQGAKKMAGIVKTELLSK